MLVVLVAVNTTKAMKSRNPYFCKALQSQEERKLQKHQGRKRNETKKGLRMICAIFSACCNVNLRCGDGNSRFAWHLRHLEDIPFQVIWCCRILQIIIAAGLN